MTQHIRNNSIHWKAPPTFQNQWGNFQNKAELQMMCQNDEIDFIPKNIQYNMGNIPGGTGLKAWSYGGGGIPIQNLLHGRNRRDPNIFRFLDVVTLCHKSLTANMDDNLKMKFSLVGTWQAPHSALEKCQLSAGDNHSIRYIGSNRSYQELNIFPCFMSTVWTECWLLEFGKRWAISFWMRKSASVKIKVPKQLVTSEYERPNRFWWIFDIAMLLRCYSEVGWLIFSTKKVVLSFECGTIVDPTKRFRSPQCSCSSQLQTKNTLWERGWILGNIFEQSSHFKFRQIFDAAKGDIGEYLWAKFRQILDAVTLLWCSKRFRKLPSPTCCLSRSTFQHFEIEKYTFVETHFQQSQLAWGLWSAFEFI